MRKGIIILLILAYTLNVSAQNYDESRVPAYTLPDVLKTTANKPVTNKSAWEKERRPEILALFENNVYGQMPKSYHKITYSVTNENAVAMNGNAHLKQILIEVFNNEKSVKIDLVLFIPNHAKKPVPAFLLINNRPKENTDPSRAKESEFWPAELLIDSGYAIAAFHVSDLAPDDKETFVNGALQLYPDQLATDNGMRAIGCWAWGASRVMDYFENNPEINAKRVAIVGHSRGGKASLWAAAQDQRFAICVSNCSGNTGAALARKAVRREDQQNQHFIPPLV